MITALVFVAIATAFWALSKLAYVLAERRAAYWARRRAIAEANLRARRMTVDLRDPRVYVDNDPSTT